MTIQQFGDATYYVQRTMVKFHGVFLLKKKVDNSMVCLYQLEDFYVEVSYSTLPDSTPLIRCYSIEEIDEYVFQVDITSIQDLLG
jgi:hypothetical protein